MTDQPRDTAGRYREVLKDDPGQLALDSGTLDLGSTSEGTFEFPPFLPDAPRIIDFWSRVEVSEEVLVLTVAAYDARHTAAVNRAVDLWNARNPRPQTDSKVPEWEAARLKWVRNQVGLPDRIPELLVRPLVRLAKMWKSSGYLVSTRPADTERVRSLQVTFPGGRRQTVQEWLDEFQMLDLVPYMNDMHRRAEAFQVANEARGV